MQVVTRRNSTNKGFAKRMVMNMFENGTLISSYLEKFKHALWLPK